MANKPLKSITFPGLTDTYTIPQIDPTLSQPGQAAAADKTGAVRDAFEALGMSVVDGKPCMTFLTDEEVEG